MCFMFRSIWVSFYEGCKVYVCIHFCVWGVVSRSSSTICRGDCPCSIILSFLLFKDQLTVIMVVSLWPLHLVPLICLSFILSWLLWPYDKSCNWRYCPSSKLLWFLTWVDSLWMAWGKVLTGSSLLRQKVDLMPLFQSQCFPTY